MLVHPESIVHSMVEFVDGSVVAQMSTPDMRLPIQYAFTFPARARSRAERLDLARLATLTFREPDVAKFPCLAIGMEVAREGGTSGAVFNAANEVAVNAFLEGRLTFAGIPRVIRAALERHRNTGATDLETVLEADRWARTEAEHCLQSTSSK